MNSKEFSRYNQQRRAAKQRGIPWQFTFEEWVQWWEGHAGSDWYNKRGVRATQLCMARRGDTGPYHPGNVECVTNSVNQFGKLTVGMVREIYQSQESFRALSALYGVNRTIIKRIKRRRNWKAETEGLGPPGKHPDYNIAGRSST